MKKVAGGAMMAFLLVCAFLYARAETKTSVDLGISKYMNPIEYGGKSQKGISTGIDIDILRHHKFLTWGLGYRKNSMIISIGSLQSDNISILLGYYSNFDKSKWLGWHLTGGLGAGSFSGMDEKYRGIGYSQNYELNCGLDWVLARQTPFRNPDRHRSDATVVSLELKRESFKQRIRQTDSPGTEQEKILSANRFSPTVKIMFFFGK